MGKLSDLSPRKVGQINVLLTNSSLKQKEIAKKLGVSSQTVSVIKKKMKNNEHLYSNKIGKCGRKRKTTPRVDRKIKNMALSDRRASCRKISSELAAEGIAVDRKTVNNRLLEAGLHSYCPRKKPRLTPKMIDARHAWAKQHNDWTSEKWGEVRPFQMINKGISYISWYHG